MDRGTFAKSIRSRFKDRYGKDISIDTIRKLLTVEEEVVMEAIATNNWVQYKWGLVGGGERAPHYVSPGAWGLDKRFGENSSLWNPYGYPYIRWSKPAYKVYGQHPKEYFNLIEHKYTSAARFWRLVTYRPELEEFSNLNEIEINDFNREANVLQRKLSKIRYKWERGFEPYHKKQRTEGLLEDIEESENNKTLIMAGEFDDSDNWEARGFAVMPKHVAEEMLEKFYDLERRIKEKNEQMKDRVRDDIMSEDEILNELSKIVMLEEFLNLNLEYCDEDDEFKNEENDMSNV